MFDQKMVDVFQKEIQNLREQMIAGGIDHPFLKEKIDRFEFYYKGFDCLLNRGPLGSWCGYVGLKPGHQYYGKTYGEIEEKIQVHGGVTYSRGCEGVVCHKTDNETDSLWWLGFDCSHGGDDIPTMVLSRKMIPTLDAIFSKYSMREEEYHYWTVDEVMQV